MHEEIIMTLPTATAVAEYARINGFDAAGAIELVELWNAQQASQEAVIEDTSTSE